ncbi:hypothetical protein [Flammeovirga pacifica]|uniref:hypothetical protein n=1 Tax=Flammeovirga pacifica TaxID=915059 RepID=UPI0011147347|nr:hypothetical protein [Flammeovirga pacifica]
MEYKLHLIGIYAFGTVSGSLMSNASGESVFNFTVFPNMPFHVYASGRGGEVAVESFIVAYSSGYWGASFSVGVGGAILQVEGNLNASYSCVKPIKDISQLKFIKSISDEKQKNISCYVNFNFL